jgi:hypothetical protein
MVSQMKTAVQMAVPKIKKFLEAFFPIRNLLSCDRRLNFKNSNQFYNDLNKGKNL